jgi:DNA-binding MarR family transcriptional regulator
VPASSPDIRPSYLIGRLDRLIRSGFDDVLAQAGLTLPEYTAMSVLLARPGFSSAQLARRSLITPQAMGKVVIELERRGYIKRPSTGHSGRARGIMLTRRGQAVLDKVQPQIAAAAAAVLHRLSPEQHEQLVELLQVAGGVGERPTADERPAM